MCMHMCMYVYIYIYIYIPIHIHARTTFFFVCFCVFEHIFSCIIFMLVSLEPIIFSLIDIIIFDFLRISIKPTPLWTLTFLCSFFPVFGAFHPQNDVLSLTWLQIGCQMSMFSRMDQSLSWDALVIVHFRVFSWRFLDMLITSHS